MSEFSSVSILTILSLLLSGCAEPPLWKGDVPAAALAGTWVITDVPEDLEEGRAWIGRKAFVLESNGTAAVLFGPVPKLVTGIDVASGTGRWSLCRHLQAPSSWTLDIVLPTAVVSADVVKKTGSVALLKVYNPNYGTFFLFEKFSSNSSVRPN
jgi:hypothetical protein